jgi:hypothetical protein
MISDFDADVNLFPCILVIFKLKDQISVFQQIPIGLKFEIYEMPIQFVPLTQPISLSIGMFDQFVKPSALTFRYSRLIWKGDKGQPDEFQASHPICPEPICAHISAA